MTLQTKYCDYFIEEVEMVLVVLLSTTSVIENEIRLHLYKRRTISSLVDLHQFAGIRIVNRKLIRNRIVFFSVLKILIILNVNDFCWRIPHMPFIVILHAAQDLNTTHRMPFLWRMDVIVVHWITHIWERGI
jgi:hypothetical protein